MWWPAYIALCVIVFFWPSIASAVGKPQLAPHGDAHYMQAATIFLTPLVGAVTLMSINPPFTSLWFFAIYACVGALTFFLLDWKRGALVTLVSLPSAAHAGNYITALQRDITGEFLFVVCMCMGAYFGPSSGFANRLFVFGRSGSDRARDRRAPRLAEHSKARRPITLYHKGRIHD